MNKANHRSGMIAIIKFLAAIGIVYFHTIPGGEYHWSELKLLVELFFFITGYYTFKHFQSIPYTSTGLDNKAANAIKYTINKFKKLFPYIIIAIIFRYVTLLIPAIQGGLPAIINVFKALPFEFILLGSQSRLFDWPLWFISAMAIVFPLFCLICQTKNKYFVTIISALICTVYYSKIAPDILGFGIHGISSLVRAFVGLITGITIYTISENIRDNLPNLSTQKKIILQLFEIMTFTGTIVLLSARSFSPNAPTYRSLIIISFFIYLCTFMSGKTYTYNFSSRIADFLEKVSMVIFMIHIPIISTLNIAQITIENKALYNFIIIIFSFIISTCILCVVEYIKIQKKLNKGQIVIASS